MFAHFKTNIYDQGKSSLEAAKGMSGKNISSFEKGERNLPRSVFYRQRVFLLTNHKFG